MRKLLAILLLAPSLVWGQADLTGSDPGDTYGGLLHLSDAAGVDGDLADVYDGLGTATALQVSTTTVGAAILQVGGGYGDTGFSASAAGVLQCNGAFTTDGAMTADSAVIGGGYGDTGCTISTAGVLECDGNLTAYGTIQSGANGQDGVFALHSEQGGADFQVTFQPHATMTENTNYTLPADEGAASTFLKSDGDGALSWALPEVAEADTLATVTGRGATTDTSVGLNGGITVDTTNFTVNGTTGAVVTASSLTADSAAIGGGYGSTGASISNAGVGQFNGALTTDGALTASSNGSTMKTLDLGAAAATSVLTFDGADAAGNWKLIDFSGAAGVAASADYLLYQDANNYWNGAGTLKTGAGLATTNVTTSGYASIGSYTRATYHQASAASVTNSGNFSNYALGQILHEGATNDADELIINFPSYSDGGAGDQGGESDPTTTLMVGRCTSETLAATGDGNPQTDTLDPVQHHNCYLYTCDDTDTCDVTMAETNAYAGQILMITNTTANAVDFADQANVLNINGGAVALATDDTITLMYTGTQWLEISRSDN